MPLHLGPSSLSQSSCHADGVEKSCLAALVAEMRGAIQMPIREGATCMRALATDRE